MTTTYVYADDGEVIHLVREDDLGRLGERARTLCGTYGTADLSFGDETQSGLRCTCNDGCDVIP